MKFLKCKVSVIIIIGFFFGHFHSPSEINFYPTHHALTVIQINLSLQIFIPCVKHHKLISGCSKIEDAKEMPGAIESIRNLFINFQVFLYEQPASS